MPKANDVNTGIEPIQYRVPKTWAKVPKNIKTAPSLVVFKDKLKNGNQLTENVNYPKCTYKGKDTLN